jgi:hypothetical protein
VKFYLGAQHPTWLERTDVPLFYTRARLESRRTFPRAAGTWALDSGGYTEINTHGKWMTTAKTYAALVRTFSQEVGNLEWAACQDWTCHPDSMKKTGLTVKDHQVKTVASFVELLYLDDALPIAPVLQGVSEDDFKRCVDLYANAGINLLTCSIVAIGSIAHRQDSATVSSIVRWLWRQGIRLHAFGWKLKALSVCSPMLATADSISWATEAKLLGKPQYDTCTHKKHCGNCLRFALDWRRRLLDQIASRGTGGTGLFRGPT